MEATVSKSDQRQREKQERREESRLRHEKRHAARADRDRRLKALSTRYLAEVAKVWAWWKSQ